MVAEAWQEQLRVLAARWSVIPPENLEPIDADWRAAFERVRTDYLRLIDQGRWLSGPRDLMTVLGATDDELSHSRVVAWLLQPTGRHGLGTSVLRRLLEAGWAGFPVPDLGAAIIEREVPREDGISASRADVIVTAAPLVLVIENKVWAAESEGQCETLYRHWKTDEAADVRFLLLSRDGHPPYSAKSDEARMAWRAMSYRHLAGLLTELTDETDSPDPPRRVIQQYLTALRRLVGTPAPFAITGRG